MPLWCKKQIQTNKFNILLWKAILLLLSKTKAATYLNPGSAMTTLLWNYFFKFIVQFYQSEFYKRSNLKSFREKPFNTVKRRH